MSVPQMERGLLKALLSLNGNLPPENVKIWITVKEMRDRLVHCGVHQSVSTDHLVQALTRVNKGEGLLARRRKKGTAFYRRHFTLAIRLRPLISVCT